MDQFTISEDFPKNLAAFDKRFNTEETCQSYLFKLRWPDGFNCTKCDNDRFWKSARGLYICTCCEHHHSITSGTIMAGTRKPLVAWFKPPHSFKPGDQRLVSAGHDGGIMLE